MANTAPPPLLIVEDDLALQKQIRWSLDRFDSATAADREVVIVGRSLRRVIDVAGELGMLAGLRPFYEADAFGYLPREKVVAIVTGSQGEPRAVLSRVAEGDHGTIELSRGDTVVFSKRQKGRFPNPGEVAEALR